MKYIGRFAPSPSGEMHLGSIYSALISYLDAKKNNGLWKVRIDDIDSDRSKKVFTQLILKVLNSFGLEPDEVNYQTNHLDAYESYLKDLLKNRHYFCECSRERIKKLPQGIDGYIYDQKCKNKKLGFGSIRIETTSQDIKFTDGHFGEVKINLQKEINDFVIHGHKNYVYQFCCVIDDYITDINNVVRGSDLLYSSPKQIYLQNLLGLPKVNYFHHPVIYKNNKKISKSEHASPVNQDNKNQILLMCLHLAGQEADETEKNYHQILKQAINNWDRNKLPKTSMIEI